MHCYKILITGSVFKTGYRYHLKAKASLLEITGLVYYENENSVGVIASGSNEKMKKFLEFCQVGYPLVQITNAEIFEVPYREFSSFEVVDEKPEMTSLPNKKQRSNNK